LNMQATVCPISEGNLGRVTQLVNKTNQFNLTTQRYTEGQIRDIAARGAWCGVFALSDRFGDHGIVGLLCCVPVNATTWEIDTWLMSCRVLGRQLERFMLDCAIDAARAAGIARLIGVYRPTAKNTLVANLFEQLGFVPLDATVDGARHELLPQSVRGRLSAFIERVPADAATGVTAGAAGA
jgi:FkbH-like protein